VIVIAGLGNPGEKHKSTRHNIGFMVTGALAEKFGVSGKFSTKFNAIIGKGKIKGTEVLLVQPQTFMNLSGEAISGILNWHKTEINNLFVVFDDVTLDFGKIRFRPSGSAGSHNGVKSIISHCGNEEFSRLKVGIGPNPGESLWKNFVLQKFSPEEQKHLPEIIDLCVEAVEFYLKEGIDAAQNKYNGINILD